MAKVTVQMPAAVDALPGELRDAAVVALAITTEEVAGRARLDPDMPVDRGNLRRAVVAAPVRVLNDRIRGGVMIAGEAAQRGVVMEGGRRAGAPGPSWRHLAFALGARGSKSSNLAAMRGGWIFRNRREDVEAKAATMRAAYLAAHPGKPRKKTQVARKDYWLAKAIVALAMSTASAIHNMGIRARLFVRRQIPFLNERLRERLRGQLVRRGIVTRSGQ